MKTVEGVVRIGTDEAAEAADGDDTHGSRFPSLDAFIEFLESVGDGRDVTIQAFDARYVAGEEHLQAAVDHAERAMERGTNVASDLAVEILCYAAGRRQIDQAMELGLSTGEQEIVVVVHGPDAEADAAAADIRERIEPAETAPDEDSIAEYFDVTDRERSASEADLETLVIERVALLDVEK